MAKSRAAFAEIKSVLESSASAEFGELVTSAARDMILTLPVFESRAVPNPIREVRKMASCSTYRHKAISAAASMGTISSFSISTR